MEKTNDISILIALLPQYRHLNTLYEQVADSLELSFESQCRITDFYNEFSDKQSFEKSVINLLLSTDKEKSATIITNLRTEIGKNIDLYLNNKDLFNGIDTFNICTDRHNPLHIEIKGQLKDTNKLWQELTQVRNSLESASWNNDEIRVRQLTKEEERLESDYKKKQGILESLYSQLKESDNHAFQYIKNVFSDIFELNNSFSSLLNNYFPLEKEKEEAISVSEPETVPTESESVPEQNLQAAIEPDMIFKTNMYNKFLLLEKKLIEDKYLNEKLNWISVHDNGKSDIKRLVTFLTGLIDNRYFLPGKDTKIKSFFETRYHITIGQNFEPKRREPLLEDYKAVFCDYPF